MKKQLLRYPTPEEMGALNAAAHRARARHMKLLFRRSVRALKWFAAHFAAIPVAKRVSHA
jgi:hypothetical protein